MTVPKNYRCVDHHGVPEKIRQPIVVVLNWTRSYYITLLKEFIR